MPRPKLANPKIQKAVRIPSDLDQWIEGYTQRKKLNFSQVIVLALHHLRQQDSKN